MIFANARRNIKIYSSLYVHFVYLVSMELLKRKDLPNFGYLKNIKFDINEITTHCQKENLFNFDDYADIQVSSNSKMKEFVLSNSYSKSNFFTENAAAYLEGNCYKQKYFTELNLKIIDQNKIKDFGEKKNSIFFRQKRLNKSFHDYDPIADELNYTKRNHLVKGIFEKILDSFQSQVTRVRLAYLAPHFKLKPHIDYDPSYITRYHIPILTNKLCHMHVIRNNQTHSANFPADGRVYFLNAGLKHWAENNSDFPRLHLILDTHGQLDLQESLVEYV